MHSVIGDMLGIMYGCNGDFSKTCLKTKTM